MNFIHHGALAIGYYWSLAFFEATSGYWCISVLVITIGEPNSSQSPGYYLILGDT